MDTIKIRGELTPAVAGEPPTTFTLELEAKAIALEPGHTLVLKAPDDANGEVMRAALPELKRLHPDNPVLVVQGSRWEVFGLGDLKFTADAIGLALEVGTGRTDPLFLLSFHRHALLKLRELVLSLAGAAR